MAWFACYGLDDPQKLSVRLAHRQAHLARVQMLDGEGRILACGPLLQNELSPTITDAQSAGFAGSLLIADFADLSAAKVWWNADPYVQNGVFQHTAVYPWIRAFPQH